MGRFTPEQLSDDCKILRFLDPVGLNAMLGIQKNIARQVIDLCPTFLLRSLEYYQMAEDYRADKHENVVVTVHPENGMALTNTNLNPILTSCWSTYRAEDLTLSQPWAAFPGSIAVIESTVGDVKKIIETLCHKVPEDEKLFAMNNGSVRGVTVHGKIQYYDPNDHFGTYQNQGSLLNCFLKRREPYASENEYRFAVVCDNHLLFSPYTFIARLSMDAMSYVKKIYVKQDALSKSDKDKIMPYYQDRVEEICVPAFDILSHQEKTTKGISGKRDLVII